MPGQAFEFTFIAAPEDYLTFEIIGQSNDLVVAGEKRIKSAPYRV